MLASCHHKISIKWCGQTFISTALTHSAISFSWSSSINICDLWWMCWCMQISVSGCVSWSPSYHAVWHDSSTVVKTWSILFSVFISVFRFHGCLGALFAHFCKLTLCCAHRLCSVSCACLPYGFAWQLAERISLTSLCVNMQLRPVLRLFPIFLGLLASCATYSEIWTLPN